MAEYPGIEHERRFSHEALHAVVRATFERCGMADPDAEVLTDQLVKADLRGIHSHGVMRVPLYVDKLTRGGVDPRGRPRVTRDAPAALVIDGGNSMGQIAGAFAMPEAIEHARTTGVAVAAVGNSNHSGAMQCYVRLTIRADMIGIATTNALPTMAPWGGHRQAGQAQSDRHRHPGGRGAAARARLRVWRHGARADAGVQAEGHPDSRGLGVRPARAPDHRHRRGARGPGAADRHVQGIGLAMAAGILPTLLSGAGYGTESGNMVNGPIVGRDGQFYLALKIEAFEDVATFKARMDRITRAYRGTRLAPGIKRVFVPGEMEAEREHRQRQEGVPLNEATMQGLRGVAAKLGVDGCALQRARASDA